MLTYFPISARAKEGVVGLVVAILIYVVVAAIFGWVIGFLGGIALGKILGIIGWIFEVYCTIGVIVAILAFLKIVK